MVSRTRGSAPPLIKNKMMNKRGWIRIVEAFLAILLVTAVLVIVVNQQNTKQNDSSSKVYNYEIYILRIIELNDTLRNQIIGVSSSLLPLTSDNETYFPANVINQINLATPGSFVCAADSCTRIRALPIGTTGYENPMT